jgi:putative FmdB family regulatory protein
MPVYEYQCNSCGVRFERLQSINDEPVKKCPECGEEVRRLIHPVGIIFKGKGFYVTDNRKAKSSTSVTKAKEESTSTTSTAKKDKETTSSKGQGDKKDT